MEDQNKELVEVNADEMEFTIPFEGISYVEDALEKLNKRAGRLGLKPMKLVKVKTFEKIFTVKYKPTIHFGLETDGRGNVKLPVKLITLRIEGEPPKLPGYKLIARLDWKEGNPLIAEVPGETAPTKYRSIAQGCDHCNKKANRNDTFVLQDTKTNEYVQIGRSCLKDFLGHADRARNIVKAMEFFQSVSEWLSSLKGLRGKIEWDALDQEELDQLQGYMGRRSEPVWMMDDFLPLVVMLAKTRGYVGAAKARELETESTGSIATHILNIWSNPRGVSKDDLEYARETMGKITDEHKKIAEDMLAKVIEEYEKDPNAASTYLYNIYNIAKDGMNKWIGRKKVGLAASIYQFYMKELSKNVEREEKKKDITKASEWVGEVGKRVDLKLRISRPNYSFETMYGPQTIMFFSDDDGNQFTWKTSSPIDGNPGDWFDVKATIKKHGEYKGSKQTELSRLKVTKKHEAEKSEQKTEANEHVPSAYSIDRDGDKIIGWHGTRGIFNDMLTAKQSGQTDWGFYGKGIYFSNSKSVARGYANAGNGMLIKARLDISNPFVMDTRTQEKREASARKLKEMGAKLDPFGYPKDRRHAVELSKLLKKNGYDGIIVYGQGIEYVVFDPKQIREISREEVNPSSRQDESSLQTLTLADLRALALP